MKIHSAYRSLVPLAGEREQQNDDDDDYQGNPDHTKTRNESHNDLHSRAAPLRGRLLVSLARERENEDPDADDHGDHDQKLDETNVHGDPLSRFPPIARRITRLSCP